MRSAIIMASIGTLSLTDCLIHVAQSALLNAAAHRSTPESVDTDGLASTAQIAAIHVPQLAMGLIVTAAAFFFHCRGANLSVGFSAVLMFSSILPFVLS